MKLYGYDWISLPLVYTQVLLIHFVGVEVVRLVVVLISRFQWIIKLVIILLMIIID